MRFSVNKKDWVGLTLLKLVWITTTLIVSTTLFNVPDETFATSNLSPLYHQFDICKPLIISKAIEKNSHKIGDSNSEDLNSMNLDVGVCQQVYSKFILGYTSKVSMNKQCRETFLTYENAIHLKTLDKYHGGRSPPQISIFT